MSYNSKKNRDVMKILLSLSAILILVWAGHRNNILLFWKKEPFRRYNSTPNISTAFHFSDASALLGPPILPGSLYLRPGDRAQGVHIADINADGFDDIFYLYTDLDGKDKAKLLINKSGLHFSDATVTYKIPELIGNDTPVGAGLADLNNDGFQDLVLSFISHKISISYGNGKSFLLSNTNFYALPEGDARSISFLDFDRDHFVDIYIGSYFKDLPNWSPPHWARDTDCGQNLLLKNINGKNFKPMPATMGVNDTNCTFTSVAADFDNDGYQDLFVPADYGVDRIYKNNAGKEFLNVSRSALGFLRSRASMGVDIADIFAEGKLSAYITNTNLNLGLAFGMNSLWYNKSTIGNLAFSDLARDTYTDQCGHSWGARFLDPDRNGYPDLFVTNAVTRTIETFWNLRFYYLIMADALQKLVGDELFFYTPKRIEKPAPCFFLNSGRNEPWKNIASSIGLEKIRGGRTIAVFDFNKDGQEDILVGTLYSSPTLWKGNYMGNNHWIGFRLVGDTSNRDAIGAKILLKTKSQTQLKEITVGGGFQSSNSKSLLFGIPNTEIIAAFIVQITWPSGKKQEIEFNKNQMNRYHTIREN